ncbi:MAG: hypothetical protein HYZ14_00750 [Bacteroidetes bacterium]|nr:hypothetical protein [Bacteroidota bacterium]
MNELVRGFVVAVLAMFFTGTYSFSQSIWTNPITGTDPGLSNPYTTGNVFDANISVAGISHGTGVNGNAGSNRYNTNGWNTGAIDLNAYFQFTLTPNSGCEIDFTSFVYTGQLSTGTMSFAFRSSVDGFTADIGTPVTAGTTISLAGAAYQNITTAITFRLYGWGSAASGTTYSINDFTFNGTVTCGGCPGPVAEPTTETTADTATPGCTSVILDWTASTTADNVLVVMSTAAISDTPTDGTAYTASTTFGSGEELVLADGQYVVYNGTGTTVTVTGLTAGTTYNYAIFGYDGVTADCEENYLTGGNFGSFTTPASCGTAEITSLMVNSCNGTNEGTDELIIIENGDELINVDDMIISLPNTTWCNNGCAGVDGAIVNNPTYVSNLNAMAGCSPDLFVYADPIPAGATIIIFTGNPPSAVLDYSANCGAPGAPMYVLFLDNSSITGNFANSGSTVKVIDIDFGNGQSDAVSYLPDNVANVDGGSVNYDAAGNATYYTSTDCVYPLAIRLAYFEAEKTGSRVALTWGSYSEVDAAGYDIQRSADGLMFETIGTVAIQGNSDFLRNYTWYDESPLKNPVTYYRLAMSDIYQAATYSHLVSVAGTGVYLFYKNNQIVFQFDQAPLLTGDLIIYAADGSVVYEGSLLNQNTIPFYHRGIFFVEIPELHYRVKIACF